jgi:glycosyltransferase involved in cell wall biosynthesis
MSLEISVVLVCFDRGRFLRETIDSILTQTFTDFELIICDDCSTDDTPEICREYARRDKRIQYHRNPQNLGMPQNLNLGIERSGGKYIANLHDGDIYSADLIELWHRCAIEYPTVGFVFNEYADLDEMGEICRIERLDLEYVNNGRSLIRSHFFTRWMFNCPVWGSCMVPAAVYKDIGLFDPKYRFYADIDLWLRIAERYDVGYIRKPLIYRPSRERVPRLFKENALRDQTNCEKIFLEGRLRYYRDKKAALAAELVRHAVFAIAARARIVALLTRKYVTQRFDNSRPCL